MQKLSVITINFNNKSGLQKTIANVSAQTYKDLEYIVIDGGSTDGSVELIEENEKNISFSQSEPDKGIYDAMNKGITKATGEYLLFLNSGDVLVNNKIIEEIFTLPQNAGILYGDLVTVNEKREKKQHKSFSEANVYNLMISTIWHPCSFIKRELFSKCGLYNTGFKMAGDYEFFIRSIIKFGTTAKYIKKSIAEFDMQGVSNKKDNSGLMDMEREKAWQLNFSEPMIDFFERSVTLYRSREYKLGKLITKFIP